MCASATSNPTFVGTLTRCVQRPRLNFDILLEVCKFLPEVRDIISLSTTCFDLRRPSVRHLLLSRTVVVNYDDVLDSFFQFLFDAEGTRPVLLRDLKIKLQDSSSRGQSYWKWLKDIPASDLQESFQTILLRTPNLQRLDLGGPSHHPALSRSTSYKADLAACMPFRITPALLTSLPSSLKTLKGLILPIKSGYYEDDDDEVEEFEIEDIYPEDLHQFVGHLSSTLEDLEVDALNTFVEHDPSSPQYPTIRSLRVAGLFGIPALDVLMHTFPSLDRSLTLLVPSECRRSELDELEWVAVHSRNVEGQQDQSWPAPWKHIDRLTCDSQLLYLLGLKISIGHTYLLMDDLFDDRNTKDYLVAGLRVSLPVRLTLDFLHVESTSDLEFFDGVFPEELGGSLTHLAFGFQYREERLRKSMGRISWKAYKLWFSFVDVLCKAVIPLTRLTHLHIVIYRDERFQKHCFFDTPFRTMPARLAAVLPSLQYIFVTCDPEKIYKDDGVQYGPATHGWRVVKCPRYDGQPNAGEESREDEAAAFMLETIHHHKVEALLKAEELEVYDEKINPRR